MIMKTINEVASYSKASWNLPIGQPDRPLEPRIEPADWSDVIVRTLGLPKEYVTFCKKYRVENAVIGSLVMSPHCTGSLVETLVNEQKYNSGQVYPPDFVWVASYDADFLLVKAGAHLHGASTIYILDAVSGIELKVKELAPNFQAVAIMCGNIGRLISEGNNLSADEIVENLTTLELSLTDEMLGEWKKLVEMSI